MPVCNGSPEAIPATDNRLRVDRAQEGLNAYLARVNEMFAERDALTHLIDLLADLRHWADAHQVDFTHASIVSRAHWLEETHSRTLAAGTRS